MNIFITIGVILIFMELTKQISGIPNSQDIIVQQVNRYKSDIQSASNATGISYEIIAAIIYVESSGNPYAQSSAGAYGLMQINTSVWGLYARPQSNILKGSQILAGYLAETGDLTKALQYYNAGPSTVIGNPNAGLAYAKRVESKMPLFANE